MHIYDKTFKLIQRVTEKGISFIAKRIDPEELRQDINNTQYTPCKAILRAGDRLLADIKHKHINVRLEAFMLWILWKATHSSNYRPMLFQFLKYLQEELKDVDLDEWGEDPHLWMTNIIETRRKK